MTTTETPAEFTPTPRMREAGTNLDAATREALSLRSQLDDMIGLLMEGKAAVGAQIFGFVLDRVPDIHRSLIKAATTEGVEKALRQDKAEPLDLIDMRDYYAGVATTMRSCNGGEYQR